MIFGRSSCQVCVGAASFVLGGLMACNAQPGGNGRGRPIEFSAPRRDGVTTNWNQSMTKPDSLKQLEEDAFKPLQPAAPQSSLDGVVAFPPRPAATTAIQNNRVKEMLDRQKNWAFMSREEMFGSPTVEGILKGPPLRPDGKEQKDVPALERYYERLSAKEAAAKDPAQTRNEELYGSSSQKKPGDESGGQDDSELPSTLKESAEALKKMVGQNDSDNPFVQGATHGSLADIFGLGDNTQSKEQIQDHKKFLDDYHSVLDATWQPPAVAVPGSPLDILGAMGSPAGKPAPVLPSVSSPALNSGLEVQAGALNPILGPPGLSDVNAQALGQTKPTSLLPKVEPPRVMPIAPSFEAPRRAFH